MTISGDNLKSVPITNLDAQPILQATTGEGAAGYMKCISDNVATTASAVATSAYRLARFPSNAKVKRVKLDTINLGSTAGATLDINVAFSDSTTDGTSNTLQAAIPTSALTGAVTTPAAYSSPNKMFGSAVATGATNGQLSTDVTYQNSFTAPMRDIPMWANLGGSGAATASPLSAGGGFAQNNGQIVDPGGFFDIYVVIAATGTGTVTAGNIGIQVDYVV